ncbi:hypothetical protein AHAS_Ahas12G0100200 [Arachis hypogaea]
MSESSKDARKRRKLAMKRKKDETLGIRNDEGVMHDILDDVFTSFVDINDHVLFASSETKGYLDHGDCNYTCTWCGAGFWYDERVSRESKVSQPVFSMCCLKEKVQLPLLKEPPELLVSLLSENDPKNGLDENNVVAKSFRMAKEFYQQRPTEAFSIRLFRHRAADPRVYNEPTVSEIAGLIIGDFDGSDTAHDIIVQWRNGDFKMHS